MSKAVDISSGQRPEIALETTETTTQKQSSTRSTKRSRSTKAKRGNDEPQSKHPLSSIVTPKTNQCGEKSGGDLVDSLSEPCHLEDSGISLNQSSSSSSSETASSGNSSDISKKARLESMEESPNAAGILLASVALTESNAYKKIIPRVYKNHKVPDYASRDNFYWSKNVSELVTRQFLKDVEAELRSKDERNARLEKELEREKAERKKAEKELREVQAKYDTLNKEHQTLLNALKQRFSQTQIDRIINPKSKTHWSQSDIRKAITMLSVSEMGYLVAKRLLGLPMAARSGVKNLLSKIDFDEGVLGGVLDLMKLAGEGMTLLQRQVVLSFDEVQLAYKLVYNDKKDQVEGPHKLMQAACITGLFSNYTNPVYYKNSQPMTKKILLDIIAALHGVGFHVRVVVCDLGLDNVNLMKKELKVDPDKPYFEHPSAKHNVYVWSDPPHNEKLLRNHTLDNSINTNASAPGKEVASKWALQSLVNESGHVDLPRHPLTQEHLNVQGHGRQLCYLAHELLDPRVAQALRSLASKNPNDLYGEEELEQLKATALVCEVGNLYRDIFGVAHDEDNGSITSLCLPPQRLPFGRKLEEQDFLLKKIYETIKDWRVYKKLKRSTVLREELMEFQNGMLMACKALPLLLEDLRSTFPGQRVELLTARLTQDVVERLFGLLRTNFGPNQRPDSVEAARRLKNLILGDNLGLQSRRSNVAMNEALSHQKLDILSLRPKKAVEAIAEREKRLNEQEEQDLIGEEREDEEEEDVATSNDISDEEGTYEGNAESEESDYTDSDDAESSQDDGDVPFVDKIPVDWSPPDDIQQDGYDVALKQVAEAVAGQLGSKFPVLVGPHRPKKSPGVPSWLPVGLMKKSAPATAFLIDLVKRGDIIFREVNKNSVSKRPGIIARMLQAALATIPGLTTQFSPVMKSFFLKRLQIRTKTLNTALWNQRKRKTSNTCGYKEALEKHSRMEKRNKIFRR